MPQIKDIIKHLAILAPPYVQESYDNSGLLVGDASLEVTKILVCLDSTETVIDEAIATGCNLVIAHHPIIWGKLKSLTGKNATERVVIKAIQHKIAIYACHTNLDKVFNGVNEKFAERLKLKNTRILKPETGYLKKLVTYVPKSHITEVSSAITAAGAGIIGNYDNCTFETKGTGTFRGNEKSKPFVGAKSEIHREAEIRLETVYPVYRQQEVLDALLEAHPYEEVAYDLYALENAHPRIGLGMIGELKKEMDSTDFLKFLKIQMQTNAIRFVNTNPDRKIRKVAVCGGVGHFLLAEAIRQGADAYITSDVKYHEMMEAENHLLYADIGHYESEKFTMELLIALISQKFTNIALLFSENNINPIQYFI